MKKTPWFPSGTKPVREGVYETKRPKGTLAGYQVWDGKRCRSVAFSKEDAAAMIETSTWNPQPIWRGRTAP